ncbi:MAG: SelL-related redox protein [Bacteroidota bacterium]
MPSYNVLDFPVPEQLLRSAKTHDERNLWDMSHQAPTLLVFLRHFGCTFCRESLVDIREQRKEIEADAPNICFVHLSPESRAKEFFQKYQLADVARISDPEKKLYHAFGLERGSLGQVFGVKSWTEGFRAGILRGLGVGTKAEGDGWQMPGVFLLDEGLVMHGYRHQSVADRPDYVSLAGCGC